MSSAIFAGKLIRPRTNILRIAPNRTTYSRKLTDVSSDKLAQGLKMALIFKCYFLQKAHNTEQAPFTKVFPSGAHLTAESTEAMCLAQRQNTLMQPVFEPSASVSRSPYPIHMTNMPDILTRQRVKRCTFGLNNYTLTTCSLYIQLYDNYILMTDHLQQLRRSFLLTLI